MSIFIILVLAILLCFFVAFLCRRYVNKEFNSIENVLERILIKKFHEPINTIGEDRISKLTHKANRIIDMCISETIQTNTDKETIQGFISDLSHQMKTPLAGIAMYTELLAEDDLSEEEQQDFLLRLKISTEKLQWMMESLIKMSRLEMGAISLNPSQLSIKQTISESIIGILAEANKKNISIYVASFDDISLYHDKKWTIEVFGNILENAIKYSKENGKITIVLESLQQYTKITVTDNGIGIFKDDWSMIFKRFYRGQNVKNKDGVGLGLYLATVIMEKQGGYIMVDSIPNQFTSFSLFLQNCKK